MDALIILRQNLYVYLGTDLGEYLCALCLLTWIFYGLVTQSVVLQECVTR